MRPSEGPGSIDAPVRVFSYDLGVGGKEFTRAIAVEAPVQIVLGGAPFAVMMATPQDLKDFAAGFVLTEQIAESVADIRGIEVEAAEDGWKLKIALSGERLQAHMARARAMSGRTGCGLCGIEDFSQMPSPRPPLNPPAAIEPAAIRAAIGELEAWQPLNRATRAVHAAAWCGRDGRILLSREDVGRHNALDKAIGALARAVESLKQKATAA
jgi:FdhD protein